MPRRWSSWRTRCGSWPTRASGESGGKATARPYVGAGRFFLRRSRHRQGHRLRRSDPILQQGRDEETFRFLQIPQRFLRSVSVTLAPGQLDDAREVTAGTVGTSLQAHVFPVGESRVVLSVFHGECPRSAVQAGRRASARSARSLPATICVARRSPPVADDQGANIHYACLLRAAQSRSSRRADQDRSIPNRSWKPTSGSATSRWPSGSGFGGFDPTNLVRISGRGDGRMTHSMPRITASLAARARVPY